MEEYVLTKSKIDGYARPDWFLAKQPEYTVGWNHDSNGALQYQGLAE